VDELAERSVLAIDFGGTQIRAALITPDLKVHARRAVPTRDEDGVEAVVDRICDIATEVLADARASRLPEPIGVGISSPGPLDPWRGLVVSPPNLAAWHDVPVAARVSGATGLPAFLERDTNVAVLAEARHGAGRGSRTVIYLTISTGIGGAAILDGRPLVGPDGMAGEFGHIVLDIDGPICGCGGAGHAEAIGSGTALAREARALAASGASRRLAELAAEGGELDAAAVADAADSGDAAAAGLMARAWTAIGALCASLVNSLNPEVIVIGGSIAEHRPEILEVARAEILSRCFPVPAARVRVAPAELGDDVSLVGSLHVVNDRIGDPAFRAGAPRPTMAASSQQGASRL
jgi:glucokinase